MPNRTLRVPAALDASVEWRCPTCRKLLGLIRGPRLHIRFAQGHEYLAALPATCTCRRCRTLSSAG
jgi:rubredoxin